MRRWTNLVPFLGIFITLMKQISWNFYRKWSNSGAISRNFIALMSWYQRVIFRGHLPRVSVSVYVQHSSVQLASIWTCKMKSLSRHLVKLIGGNEVNYETIWWWSAPTVKNFKPGRRGLEAINHLHMRTCYQWIVGGTGPNINRITRV